MNKKSIELRAGGGPLPPRANPRAQPSTKGRLKGRYMHYVLAGELRPPDILVFERSGAVVVLSSVRHDPLANETTVQGVVSLRLSPPGAPLATFGETFVSSQDRVYVLRNNPPVPGQLEQRPA